MQQTIHFNTGRPYGAQGQRISATRYTNGRVTFFDHDRNIDGEFYLRDARFFNERIVLSYYDNSGYTATAESLADAKAPRGPNAAWVNAAGELV